MDHSNPRRTPAHRRGPARITVAEFEPASLSAPFVVTELAAVSGRKDRFSVSINSTAMGDVTIDFVADARLREGESVSLQQIQEIVGAVNRTIVLDKALDLLAVRARSSRDLGIRLRRAGARNVDISWTIARLEAQGYLDDGAYARQVARAKTVAGGVSRRTRSPGFYQSRFLGLLPCRRYRR